MNILQLAGLLLIVNALIVAIWALSTGSSIRVAGPVACFACLVGLALTLGGRGYEFKSPLGTLKAEAEQDVADISVMKVAIKGHQSEIERQAAEVKGTAADLKNLERKAGATSDAIQKQLALAEAKVRDLSDIAQYWDVAQLHPFGLPVQPGPGIKIQSPLSSIMEGTVQITGGKMHMTCSEEAKERYQRAINSFPTFPFAYYGMALCKRANRDPGWVDVARQAVSVFEKTTKVPGHSTTHDQALAELKGYLAETEKLSHD